MTQISTHKHLVGLLFCMLLAMGVVYGAPNHYRNADARFSLLVSQVLLEEGTTRLDSYADLLEGDYRANRQQGHVYYAYPLGPSLMSLPAVWVARLFGYDMVQQADDFALQQVLSALLSWVLLGLFYLLARRFMRPWLSVLLAAVMVFGTLVISTVGTALWNVGFLLALQLLVLWMISAPPALEARFIWWRGGLIGVCLLGAFLCRPTAALFILLVLGYLLLQDRPLFWPVALTAAAGLAIWGGLNYWQIEQPLPPYYQLIGGTQTFGEVSYRAPLWLVLYGLLLGPSRGLFVFAPLLLLAVVTAWQARLRQQKMGWLALGVAIWVTAHIAIVTSFDVWWGGVGFGSRLLVETIPGFAFLLVWGWPTAERQTQLWRVSFAAAVIVGVYINSYAGLYDPLSVQWNGMTIYPANELSMMFDWRYPQFWMSEERMCERSRVHHRWFAEERVTLLPVSAEEVVVATQVLTPLYLPEPIWYQLPWEWGSERPTLSEMGEDDPFTYYLPYIAKTTQRRLTAFFAGWGYWPEQNLAYTVCDEVKIIFGAAHNVSTDRPLSLFMGLASWGKQEITVWLNGYELDTVVLTSETVQGVRMPFPAAYLNHDGLNEITIYTSNISNPYDLETWQGVGLRAWRLSHSEE